MCVGSFHVHCPGARSALLLAMRTGRATMATALAGALGWAPLGVLAGISRRLALLVRLTLLALPLILVGALLARSTASTTPSTASPPGFSGGTVRSTIHIVVTLLLCVTWTISTRTIIRRSTPTENPNIAGTGKSSTDLSVCKYLRFFNLASGLRCSQSTAPEGYCMLSVCQFRRKLKTEGLFH
jgi:hypothetical protein